MDHPLNRYNMINNCSFDMLTCAFAGRNFQVLEHRRHPVLQGLAAVLHHWCHCCGTDPIHDDQ
jgi:hypothetical protein